ncbi:hypothetical protein EV401DRAFT_2046892, partial [Pisolithus croceorrhizus]
MLRLGKPYVPRILLILSRWGQHTTIVHACGIGSMKLCITVMPNDNSSKAAHGHSSVTPYPGRTVHKGHLIRLNGGSGGFNGGSRNKSCKPRSLSLTLSYMDCMDHCPRWQESVRVCYTADREGAWELVLRVVPSSSI